ncbi:hypothetical protein [Caballeronia novacaledonica]|uniref:Uncharacterized protein n=1 Tax=Caballeronia novacaledonica TaxID=1544861 RepID=A0AA37IGG1_9BURK|nr:hypothetical protein [Caballeronia novacaledonica]GJH29305.1 hypothetical protein CBA19CS42_32335 [Caballeronia novacaledonica]
MTPVGFPTQGEVLKFVFDAFGILARKHTDDGKFDETAKKSAQRALNRLAEETGELDSNLGQLIKDFSYLTADVLHNRAFWAFGDVFFELFDLYRHLLKNEGTFLSKVESTRFFLLDWAPRVVVLITKALQCNNVAADGLETPPDALWYLPSESEGSWEWPLPKTMQWAYELAGTSIRGFHCPKGCDEALLIKNLDSARNWLKGKSLPTWTSLVHNYNESFGELKKSRAKDGSTQLSEVQKQSIRTALFLARAATYIAKEVKKHFGDETLREFCKRASSIQVPLSSDAIHFKKTMHRLIVDEQIPEENWDDVWRSMSTQYWERLDDWQAAALQAIRDGRVTVARVAYDARAAFGSFAALPFEQEAEHAPLYSPPDGFVELLFDGLDLLKSPDLKVSAIDEYLARLAHLNLDTALPWLPPLLRSTFHYRRGEYETAFPFIKTAYERGCYCAGARQYSLLNQYIELAAKNSKWREFTQGVRWATYLGFEVRWLRDKPQTEENLKLAYTILQKARYPV